MALKGRQRSLLVWVGLALLLILALAWALMPRALPVKVVEVRQGPFRLERVDQGITQVRQLYQVSAPLSGRLQRIELTAGDTVEAGQVLARIHALPAAMLDGRQTAQAQQSVQQAQAQLQEAQAASRLAEQEAQRLGRLAAQAMVSASALAQAQAQQQQAQARVAAMQAALRQALALLHAPAEGKAALVEIRAPIKGQVLRRWQQSEAVVAAGTPLLDLGDLSQLEVAAEFLSEEASHIQPGAQAQIEGWGAQALPAKVRRVEPLGERKISALGVEEQRVKVLLDLPQVPAGLGHGYRVDARITVQAKANALLLPVEALQRDGAEWLVWRVEAGQLRSVKLKVGESDGRQREVLSGLKLGDQVVLAPSAELQDGQKVQAELERP